MRGNGLVDSYLVSWPGGGLSGCTYERSREIAMAKARELGLSFIDGSPRTLKALSTGRTKA